MRVITGSAKGYGLKAPRHMKLRPTPSRVKEAIFSSLAARIPGARVLDLFAGTGAFAIETLSRGAASAVLVEKDPHAARLIEQNLKKTHLADRARVMRADVRQAIDWFHRDGKVFDFIFADPPYDHGERPREREAGSPPPRTVSKFSWLGFLLELPTFPSLLDPEGVLLIEHFKKEVEPVSAGFERKSEFKFGDTIVGVFHHQSQPPVS